MSRKQRRPPSPGQPERNNASPYTIGLFSTSGGAGTQEASARSRRGRKDDAASDEEDAGWAAIQRKQRQSDGVRDLVMELLAELESEADAPKPALDKEWLRSHLLRLRKLSLQRPDEIIANEQWVLGVKRSLRRARRQPGRRSASSDEADDGAGARRSGARRKGARRSGARRRSECSDEGDSQSRGGKRRGTRAKDERPRRRSSDATSDQDTDDSAFEVHPNNRLARPNPRAQSALNVNEKTKKPLWKKTVHTAGKAMKLPMTTGYKLGRFIKKRRQRRDSVQSGSDSSWGERKDVPRRHSSASVTTDEDSQAVAGAAAAPRKRTLVIDGEDSDASDAGRAGKTRDGHRPKAGARPKRESLEDIPVLRETLGSRLKATFTPRRGHSRSDQASDLDDSDESDRDKISDKKREKEDKKREKEDKKREKEDKKRQKEEKKKKRSAENGEG